MVWELIGPSYFPDRCAAGGDSIAVTLLLDKMPQKARIHGWYIINPSVVFCHRLCYYLT